MLRCTIFLGAALAAFALPAAADVSKNPKSAPKGAYEMDPSHTTLTFCVMHLGLANYCGRFNKTQGTLSFNGSQPEKSKISVTIDTASVDTASDALDGKLRDDLFKVAANPTATFKSPETVTLKTTFNGGLMHPLANAYAIGFSAQGTFKRSDFGLTDVAWSSFVGDEVTLYIDSEFAAKN